MATRLCQRDLAGRHPAEHRQSCRVAIVRKLREPLATIEAFVVGVPKEEKVR